MMKKLLISLLFFGYLFGESGNFPGFVTSDYYGEQVLTFQNLPQIRVHINAPSVEDYNPDKPIGLAIFALPNGNTIEQTIGKELKDGVDWHYNIQHIGAQTRFLRQMDLDYNLITVYLEAEQKSWPTWKASTANYEKIVKKLVEHLQTAFDNNVDVILTGHSGGGRFVFSYLEAFSEIPEYVNRICFLDSDYGYDNSYGAKLKKWLDTSENNCLSVIAYNDSIALYNGQPIVSATGGTWYRSKMMKRYLDDYYTFDTQEDDKIIKHRALDGRISIILKKNPDRAILHTVQVERNGFIHTMLTGTDKENAGYEYYGDHVYDDLIQAEEIPQTNFQIPIRSNTSIGGSDFMEKIKNMEFLDREEAIYNELIIGNIPNYFRELTEIETTFNDANGSSRTVKYQVMPDYLAIGSDVDFCRIPMGPITAQRIADFYGMTMPTSKLVDNIYQNAVVKLEPYPYTPVGNENEKIEKFILHNEAINQQFSDANGVLGQLVGGIKKDVILSNKITDPSRTHHVVIYGWHKLDGSPIQPVYNGHINSYVDYSHGIRLLKSDVTIDGEMKSIHQVLKDPVLYKILSNETGIMTQTTYISDSNIPGKPTSFGIKSINENSVKIIVNPDDNINLYHLYTSKYGSSFDHITTFSENEFTIENLDQNEVLFIRLRGENSAGLSDYSEVLAAIPTVAETDRAIIVNGYDRPQAGNSFDFIRQHGMAMANAEMAFDAATNEAIVDGLLSLNDYFMADYILGDESTAEETFSNAEQPLVRSYLQNGGNLFVSGSEIAWDLDYKGSSTDKSFFNNILKAKYSADAPGDESGSHYLAYGTDDGIFSGITEINFSNSSLDIKWADALVPQNGSEAILKYSDVSSHDIAGVSFEGIFNNGTEPGKLIYLGFPFEMINSTTTRNEIMNRIIDYFETPTAISLEKNEIIPDNFFLSQNFPNPFNPTTTINYQIPKTSFVDINIYDVQGKIVKNLVNEIQSADNYQIIWDGKNINGNLVSSGMYIFQMIAKSSEKTFAQSRKMVFLQ